MWPEHQPPTYNERHPERNAEEYQWYIEYAQACAAKVAELDQEREKLIKVRSAHPAPLEFLDDLIVYLREQEKEALRRAELRRPKLDNTPQAELLQH